VLVKKHLKTLTKTYHCLRAEVLKKIKCYKCQKSGHFAKDCNVDAEDGDDDFDEDISDEEIQMPQAKGKSKRKSHHPYVAHLSYDADTSEDDENPVEYCIVHDPFLIHLLHLRRLRIQFHSAATKRNISFKEG